MILSSRLVACAFPAPPGRTLYCCTSANNFCKVGFLLVARPAAASEALLIKISMVSGPWLIFREEVFEVGLGEALGEAFFAEDIGDGLGFALLQFPNLFLDGAGGDEAVGVDRAGLADAMGAVDGLRFDGGVPPRIVEDDVAGGGEVEAGAGGAQAEEEHSGVGIFLEVLHNGLDR